MGGPSKCLTCYTTIPMHSSCNPQHPHMISRTEIAPRPSKQFIVARHDSCDAQLLLIRPSNCRGYESHICQFRRTTFPISGFRMGLAKLAWICRAIAISIESVSLVYAALILSTVASMARSSSNWYNAGPAGYGVNVNDPRFAVRRLASRGWFRTG